MRSPVVLFVLLAGCGDDGPISAVERGRELFGDPGLSDSQFNSFACATCHTVGDDGTPRVASSLRGVATRAGWWGGYEPTLLDAVNVCAVRFMRAAPLAAGDERARALYEYLLSLSSGDPEPARPLTIVENVTTVPRGDPARGRRVYDATCRVCHGAPHTGRGRLSDRMDIIPEASLAYAEELGSPDLIVIEKVRHGSFFGVPGVMQPYPVEALSDADLGAVLAYLGL